MHSCKSTYTCTSKFECKHQCNLTFEYVRDLVRKGFSTLDDGQTGGGLPPPPGPPPIASAFGDTDGEFFRGAFGGGGAVLNHFKKFARRANFLKWCRGGVWGGEAPPGISVTRALPPCLAPNFFSSENFFDRKCFRPKNFRPKTISAENVSAESFSVEIFSAGNFATEKFSAEFFFV